jgi:hypothetical protein
VYDVTLIILQVRGWQAFDIVQRVVSAALLPVFLLPRGEGWGALYWLIPLAVYVTEAAIQKMVIWRVMRAAFMVSLLYWDHVYAYQGIHVVDVMYVLCLAYDVPMIYLRRRKPAAFRIARRVVPMVLFAVSMVVLMTAKDSWDTASDLTQLLFYLIEGVIYQRTRKERVVAWSGVLGVSLVVALFSLYRPGYVTAYPHAALAGHPVSCRTIRVVGSSAVYIVFPANDGPYDNWIVVNERRSEVEDANQEYSFFLGRLALIDRRSRINGCEARGDMGDEMWDQHISYHGKRLSFYYRPDQVFVCDGVDL